MAFRGDEAFWWNENTKNVAYDKYPYGKVVINTGNKKSQSMWGKNEMIRISFDVLKYNNNNSALIIKRHNTPCRWH